MKALEIIQLLEENFPPAYQESYDNSGLCTGDTNTEITGILCCIDVTDEIIDEALKKNSNMIISHHPLIFQGLKSLTNKSQTEKLVIKAIKNDLVLFSIHTNADNVFNGVNKKICDKLGLNNCRILSPITDKLVKLVTYVPHSHALKIRQAIFDAGAGVIGNYDCCSFNADGTGTFRGNESTDPFVGKKGEIHSEPETRIETILPSYLSKKLIGAIIKVHPYEEVAYDIYPLKNEFSAIGAGMIGEFPDLKTIEELLIQLRQTFKANGIRYTGLKEKTIRKIAVCGGSGSFMINEAKKQHADVFITGDIKYHQFFEADSNLTIIDIGHYESEQFTKEIFYELLTKNLSKFAVHLSEINSNPIKYFS
jgi:dinuclear metal center YbgI/SA1388 family protein